MKLFILISLMAGSYAQQCFVVPGPANPEEDLSVADAFKKYHIVNDYIPEAPEDIFAGGFGKNEVKPGSRLSPLAVTTPAHLSYPNGKKGEKYTAVIFSMNPSLYGSGQSGASLLGIFVNSPAEDMRKGDVVSHFDPHVPALNTGEYRYVGLIYKQNGTMDPDTRDMLMLARHRSGFSAVDFAKQYGLGKPVAGNFFLTSLTSCDSQ